MSKHFKIQIGENYTIAVLSHQGSIHTAEITRWKQLTVPSRTSHCLKCWLFGEMVMTFGRFNEQWLISNYLMFYDFWFLTALISATRGVPRGPYHTRKDVLRKPADEHYVFVVSDADLSRYGISPQSWNKILMQERVHVDR